MISLHVAVGNDTCPDCEVPLLHGEDEGRHCDGCGFFVSSELSGVLRTLARAVSLMKSGDAEAQRVFVESWERG